MSDPQRRITVIGIAIATLVVFAIGAALVFRWRVFMAGGKFLLILVVIIALLIWLGRLRQRH